MRPQFTDAKYVGEIGASIGLHVSPRGEIRRISVAAARECRDELQAFLDEHDRLRAEAKRKELDGDG